MSREATEEAAKPTLPSQTIVIQNILPDLPVKKLFPDLKTKQKNIFRLFLNVQNVELSPIEAISEYSGVHINHFNVHMSNSPYTDDPETAIPEEKPTEISRKGP